MENRIVVVSRWFGGILLGGDRFRHIKQVALEAIELLHLQQCTKEPNSTSAVKSTSLIVEKNPRRSKFKKIS